MRNWQKLAAIVAMLAGVVALAASGSDSKSGDSKTSSGDHPAEQDVTVSSCALADNEFEGPDAKLSVLNHSSKPSNYLITVAFESADGSQQLDTGHAILNNLGPGQTGEEHAVSLKRELRDPAGNFTCRVVSVTRLAS